MNRLIRDGFIYVIGGTLTKATPLILLPILMNFLSPAELGDVSIFISLVAFFYIFNALATESVVSVDFFKLGKEKVTQSTTDVFLSLFVISIFLLVLSELFKGFGQQFMSLNWVYAQFAILVGTAQIITFVHLSIWQVEKSSIRYGIYTVSQSIFDIFTSLFCLSILMMAANGRIFGYGLASILFSIFSTYWLTKNGYLKLNFDTKSMWVNLHFGLYLLPHAISAWVVININRFLIAEFIDNTQVGIYFVATQIGMIVTFLAVSTQKALIPYVFELLSDSEPLQSSKSKVVKTAYYYFAAIIVLSSLCFFVFSLILNNYAGGIYSPSADILGWIMLGACFHAMGMIFTNIILYSKRTLFLSVSTITSAIIHVPIAIWFIKNHSVEGAAISFFITSFLSFILSASSAIYVLPLPWLIKGNQ